MNRIFTPLLFLLVLVVSKGIAQTGSLSGTILDEDTKETLIGVVVAIDGTTIGAATNIDGLYAIKGLQPGTYTVVIKSVGYNVVKIPAVKIEAGKNVELNSRLKPASQQLNEFVVTDFKRSNTESAVLMEMKNTRQVVSAVSSQQIQKSQDNTAAQVMQRVPGITIVENRFVMIRGLSERYNNVMINNVIAPSTEVDKRTFSFDLISSGSLDRMLIYKSGSADNPGDFAGGVIKLFTVENIDDDYVKLNIGTAYRGGTTFSPYLQSRGSKTDFLGFDNGFRQLPSAFPSTLNLKDSNRGSAARMEAGHLLSNNFVARESVALPDYSIGISTGKSFSFGERKLVAINNLNYSTGYQYVQRDFHRYLEWTETDKPILERFRFMDDNYQKETRITLLSNWTLALKKGKISFKNLLSQIGENETIVRTGEDFIQRPDQTLKNYLYGFRSRTIYTGQLEGLHELNEKNELRWVAGSSILREDEPDLRRFRTFRENNSPDERFTMILPPSSNLFETGRYYGELFEYSLNHGFDYTYKADGAEAKKFQFKTGYYLDYRRREFSSRYLSYLYPGFFDYTVGDSLSKLPLDRIFSTQNINNQNGFVIEEGTRPIDSYTASSKLGSAYISAEIPFGDFLLNSGFRTEYNIQELNSADDLGPINVLNRVPAYLPFANLSYSFSPKSLVRLGYGRTLNRPEFRELAPFLFYDYKLEAGRVGNPSLRTAFIHNVDVRFELYPRNGETFSIGGFYKYFIDPIENRTIITTEQPQFTYINADYARNYGAEVEFRKSLSRLTGSKFIDRISMNVNASLIFSQVDLGSEAVAQDRTRALQGQSPYIVNAAIYYEAPKDFSLSVVYNVFGARIYSVGDVLFPTIYELPRNSIDISVKKNLSNTIAIKAGITDLLNARYRFYQDSNRNGTPEKNTDHAIFTFRRGPLFSFSLSFDLLRKKENKQ